jgi:hypothetical protein
MASLEANLFHYGITVGTLPRARVLKAFIAGPYLVDLADDAHAIALAGPNLL